MTISIHLHTVTIWLLCIASGLIIAGPVLAQIFGPVLELGALALWQACWALAAVALLLGIGSIL